MIKRFSHFGILMIISLIILAACAIIGISVGRYSIPLGEVLNALLPVQFRREALDPNTLSIIQTIRLPRLLGAMAVGAALALSGSAYQGVFQNPLVSPDLLGVSAGSCVGAASAILLGLNNIGVQGFAFIGGIIAVGLAVLVSQLIRNHSNMILILSGIIVSGIFSSVMGILIYIADPYSELPAITFWQLGSFHRVLPDTITMILPIMLISAILLLLFRWRLNVISLGDMEANSLGVNVKRTRIMIIVCSTLLTSCAVCLSGTIGWVGLVIPHLGRQITGPDNSRLLPFSMVLGAIFMVLVDTIARTLTSSDLPISILTGLIGAPFYFILLFRQRRIM